MAVSLTNAKLVSTILRNIMSRCGYATTSQGVALSKVKGVRTTSAKTKKTGQEKKEKMAWVPDPTTGYYRPENCGDDIDAAHLRATFLKHKANN